MIHVLIPSKHMMELPGILREEGEDMMCIATQIEEQYKKQIEKRKFKEESPFMDLLLELHDPEFNKFQYFLGDLLMKGQQYADFAGELLENCKFNKILVI